jgi:hypothetical protein
MASPVIQLPNTVSAPQVAQALLLDQSLNAADAALFNAIAGQDLEVLLQAILPDGVQLRLPSGQALTAQGQLPYPEGTQLKVRVAQTDRGLQLQTLEATPPSRPSLLAPLFQSEASALLSRLGQAEPSEALLPLLRLMQSLAETQPDATESSTSPAQKTAVPSQMPQAFEASLQAFVQTLPPSQLQSLAQALKMPATSNAGELLAQLVLKLAPSGEEAADAGPDVLIAKIQHGLEALSEVPPEHQEILKNGLVQALARERSSDTANAPSTALGRTASAAMKPSVLSAQEAADPKAAHAETWDTWLRNSLQTLSDPAASPREAPFHALQAREGTAFFEIPLPWSPQTPLQLWVESDADNQASKAGETTQRLLLGMNFSRLGETRVGMMRAAGRLQIRIWTEHPEMLADDLEALLSELEGLGSSVDLRVQALPESSAPPLRALVTGSTLQAMG